LYAKKLETSLKCSVTIICPVDFNILFNSLKKIILSPSLLISCAAKITNILSVELFSNGNWLVATVIVFCGVVKIQYGEF
jgi:hypothetical protein